MKPKEMKKEKQSDPIIIPQINIKIIRLKVIGDSQLVCNRFDEKSQAMMLDKQMKKAKTAKEAKDPKACFERSLYKLDKQGHLLPASTKITNATRFGFPVIAFKAAAVDACSHVDGITKVLARGAMHIDGDYAVIDGKPKSRQDVVRIGMGVADIRFRGEFKKWSATLTIRYNANVLSAEQIVNLFNTAGFAIGVGEFRPARNGSWGMFHVA